MKQDEIITIENGTDFNEMIRKLTDMFFDTDPETLELVKEINECDKRKQELCNRIKERITQYCMNLIITSTDENGQQKGDEE